MCVSVCVCVFVFVFVFVCMFLCAFVRVCNVGLSSRSLCLCACMHASR